MSKNGTSGNRSRYENFFYIIGSDYNHKGEVIEEQQSSLILKLHVYCSFQRNGAIKKVLITSGRRVDLPPAAKRY